MTAASYVVICQQIEGNPQAGYDTYFYSDLKLHPTRDAAIKHGLRETDSDDFNIGTVKNGNLIAFGWMDKDFGDEGDGTHGGYDLGKIERQIGLRGLR